MFSASLAELQFSTIPWVLWSSDWAGEEWRLPHSRLSLCLYALTRLGEQRRHGTDEVRLLLGLVPTDDWLLVHLGSRFGPQADYPQSVVTRRRQQEQARRPHGRPENIENRTRQPTRWAPSTAFGPTTEHTRMNTERRARRPVPSRPEHLGRARVLQACSAMGGLGHAANR